MIGFELKSTQGKGTIRIDRALVRVGRAPDNTVIINELTVSRYHLNFYVKNDGLIVEDAGSQNGFLVNGLPATAATALNQGDRVFFGNLEYVVSRPGTTQGVGTQPKAAAGSPMYASVSSLGSTRASGASKRLYLYLIVLGFLGFVIFKNQDPQPNVDTARTTEEPLATLNSESYRPDPRVPKSRTQITAEGYFKEAMREFENENYVRAIRAFELAKTENPSMESIDEYLTESQARLKKQTDRLLKDAERSFSRMQFKRAKGEASAILAVLAEQIDYTRKLAQETSSAPTTNGRPLTQEEILLKIPCAKTNDSALCGKALELISKSRQLLGEEDSFR